MVFEPDVNLTKAFISQMGRTESSFRGQGFVYAVNQVMREVVPAEGAVGVTPGLDCRSDRKLTIFH